MPAAAAADLWAAIVGAGIHPPGSALATRCAWRPALPLHGHELGPGITPLQAGLGWVVAWDKPAFRGREALDAEREPGVARHLVGIATEGRRPPRAECAVLVDGDPVGDGHERQLLAGARARHRPRLRPAGASATGTRVAIDVRGTALPGTVVADAVRRAAEPSARRRRARVLRRRLLGGGLLPAPVAFFGRRLLRRGPAGDLAGAVRATAGGAGAAARSPAVARTRDAANPGCADRTARRPARPSAPAATAAGTGR